jgi:hypothetical protein
VSIRHYQLRYREEASSNCYDRRKKADKKIRENSRSNNETGGSIDEGLSNGQKPTIPEARRRYLSSVEDEKLHSPILPGGHGCGPSKWM